MVELPEGINCVRSRGRDYFYWHPHRGTAKAGAPVRLPGDPQSVEFWEKLRELRGNDADGGPQINSLPGSFGALIHDYTASPDFNRLAAATKKEYRRYHGIILTAWRDTQARKVRAKHILELRDSFAETPYKANYLIRALSALLSWGIPSDYLETNPVRPVPICPLATRHTEPVRYPPHPRLDLKNVLRKINTNRDNFVHGRLLFPRG